MENCLAVESDGARSLLAEYEEESMGRRVLGFAIEDRRRFLVAMRVKDDIA